MIEHGVHMHGSSWLRGKVARTYLSTLLLCRRMIFSFERRL